MHEVGLPHITRTTRHAPAISGRHATPHRPLMVKVAEHSTCILVRMRYSSLFSNHWHLGSQNGQGASSTKKDCILICFIGLGTVTMATQLVVNQH